MQRKTKAKFTGCLKQDDHDALHLAIVTAYRSKMRLKDDYVSKMSMLDQSGITFLKKSITSAEKDADKFLSILDIVEKIPICNIKGK